MADIGLMGCPAKLDGKAVEGVRLFKGGTIGENPTLATEFESKIPADEKCCCPSCGSCSSLISEPNSKLGELAEMSSGSPHMASKHILEANLCHGISEFLGP